MEAGKIWKKKQNSTRLLKYQQDSEMQRWAISLVKYMQDTIMGSCRALSRKGIKPVMLDTGMYLRQGEENWEEDQIMEHCELLLRSCLILYIIMFKFQITTLQPKHRNILNNVKETLRSLYNLLFLGFIKNILKSSAKLYLLMLFPWHLKGVWHM